MNSTNHSLIIPAAGLGKRLGANIPKALFPVNSIPLYLHVVKEAFDLFNEIIVVIPQGWAKIFDEKHNTLDKSISRKVIYVEQTGGRGTGFAINSAITSVTCDNVVVCWADQIGVTSMLFKQCHSYFRKTKCDLLVPVVNKSDPYVSVSSTKTGIIFEQKREGSDKKGDLSDCGVFYFKTKTLIDMLEFSQSHNLGITKNTQEFHLLNIIQDYDREYNFRLLPLNEERYGLGVNTIADANYLETLMKND